MKMLHSFGIKPTSCAGECEAMRRQMDAWGEQCDQHLPEIVGHLRKAYKATSWASLTAASMAALTTGLAFQLDWTDPIPSLVKLAIARARRP